MVMPKMGESIMEGTVLAWLKNVGDSIEEDESVLEVATDKVDTEVPSIYAGILKEILAKEGEVVSDGNPIAIIDVEQDAVNTEQLIDTDPEENVEAILEEAAETLIDEGYECFIASSVKAAVDIVETTPEIILILTDMKMPGETGADLIKIVETKFGLNIKFIVMSGHAGPMIEENDRNIAAYPFLRKPLNIENLIEMVDSVLEAKK